MARGKNSEPKFRKPAAAPEKPPLKPAKGDIHSLFILVTKIETALAGLVADVEKLTNANLAAVQVLAEEPAKEMRRREAKPEPRGAHSRGTCPACGELLDSENSSATPTGKIVHTDCKVKPLGPKPAEPVKPKAPSLEELRVAVQGYVERHGREAAEALLNEAGYTKVSEVPEEDRAGAIEAFGA